MSAYRERTERQILDQERETLRRKEAELDAREAALDGLGPAPESQEMRRLRSDLERALQDHDEARARKARRFGPFGDPAYFAYAVAVAIAVATTVLQGSCRP